ncbi:protein CsiD [Thalassobacillus devorans]|uniref:Protein CsiD n=1 Tax=Thalassobacillus devorans TaxID=279813 RepID=A0ABQ1PMK4_9BACI|nr:glutarate dioxygenase GlaH [Thalassobacillus devorans]NIK30264.1 protein CsiD [Thalassobacillus devorans]GGC99709.1 protein CsiD [Thalassobacillus devorans]
MCAMDLQKGKLELQTGKGYKVEQHPDHHRLYHIEFESDVIDKFVADLKDVSDEQLEYVPYMRLMAADKLVELVGEEFVQTIRGILHDRNTGGFTIGLQGRTKDDQDYVKFSTALTHLVGTPNFDAMSGKYYARFTVKHTDDSDSYLRQAYRTFTLHTDGTYVDEPTDWLLMMKFEEENAVGGRSRLLHLDDWEEMDYFYNHPMAKYKFTYKAPASKNVSEDILRQTFYEHNNGPCICFIDQFVYPETIDQAKYLKDLSHSMENSPATIGLDLPEGDLIMLNNHFWLHGREAFEKNTELHRELLRQRGRFAE